jgi:hypothetical protein
MSPTGPIFHEKCPGCAARIPAGYLCCSACMDALPNALKWPFLRAVGSKDRIARDEAGDAIREHFKTAKIPA